MSVFNFSAFPIRPPTVLRLPSTAALRPSVPYSHTPSLCDSRFFASFAVIKSKFRVPGFELPDYQISIRAYSSNPWSNPFRALPCIPWATKSKFRVPCFAKASQGRPSFGFRVAGFAGSIRDQKPSQFSPLSPAKTPIRSAWPYLRPSAPSAVKNSPDRISVH